MAILNYAFNGYNLNARFNPCAEACKIIAYKYNYDHTVELSLALVLRSLRRTGMLTSEVEIYETKALLYGGVALSTS